MTSKRAGSAVEKRPDGYVCGYNASTKRKRLSVENLKKSGHGTVRIEARDAHLLFRIFQTIDSQPKVIEIYGPKLNPNTQRLMRVLKSVVCPTCDGMGWWPANMYEDVDLCGDCKGSGLALKPSRRRSK